jgi:hypothetical protein
MPGQGTPETVSRQRIRADAPPCPFAPRSTSHSPRIASKNSPAQSCPTIQSRWVASSFRSVATVNGAATLARNVHTSQV